MSVVYVVLEINALNCKKQINLEINDLSNRLNQTKIYSAAPGKRTSVGVILEGKYQVFAYKVGSDGSERETIYQKTIDFEPGGYLSIDCSKGEYFPPSNSAKIAKIAKIGKMAGLWMSSSTMAATPYVPNFSNSSSSSSWNSNNPNCITISTNDLSISICNKNNFLTFS